MHLWGGHVFLILQDRAHSCNTHARESGYIAQGRAPTLTQCPGGKGPDTQRPQVEVEELRDTRGDAPGEELQEGTMDRAGRSSSACRRRGLSIWTRAGGSGDQTELDLGRQAVREGLWGRNPRHSTAQGKIHFTGLNCKRHARPPPTRGEGLPAPSGHPNAPRSELGGTWPKQSQLQR